MIMSVYATHRQTVGGDGFKIAVEFESSDQGFVGGVEFDDGFAGGSVVRAKYPEAGDFDFPVNGFAFGAGLVAGLGWLREGVLFGG